MSDFDDQARAAASRASSVLRQATSAVSRAGQVAQTVARVAQAAGSGDLGGAASTLSSLLGGGSPLSEVRFDFSSSATPGFPWHVRRAHVTEGLSELYEAVVDLSLDGLGIESDALLGSSCELHLERSSITRHVLGIARRVEYLGSLAEKPLVRVHIVPALWALSQRIDSYIFQDMTVPDVLEDVLTEGLQPFNREVSLSLQREYPVREYCVQYGESDLEFVLRLMREEGIAFYFEHDGEAEKLVLVDSNAPCQPCQTLDGGAVRVSAEAGSFSEFESVRGLEWSTHLCPTGAVVRDFDWTRPQLDLTREAQGQGEKGREQYLYPAELTIGEYSQGDRRYTKEDGNARARLSREAQETGRQRGRGQGNVTGFTPGQTFTLQGHERPELDQDYLVTRVEHVGEAPEEKLLAAPGDAAKERYFNRFECIPLSVPFRPEAPTPRRRVPGLQTATVVGPQGEEIHTDEHGRIKVQFHWDREGQRNERASCWVRVAQAWAGVGFGTLFIPRIGMEVVVDFLEGNPDRPLVIGCVYNGTNPTPTLLPDERTRSTIRTESSPGGEGYNELRFEDAAGEEEVFLHAQKDLNETVEHNHTTTVHADQANTVDGNQTNTVKGNQTQSVGGDQTENVTGKQSMTVDKNRTVHVKGSQSVTIDGSEANDGVSGSKVNITGDHKMDASSTIEIQAPTHIKLTVGGSSVMIEPGKITLQAGDGSKVVLDANALAQASGGGQVLLSGEALMQAAGGAQVHLDADAAMVSHDGSEVVLDGDARVAGKGSATMEAATEATVQGATAKLAGGAGSGGSVEATATGVAASGASVDVTGQGMVSISGAVVTLN